VLDIKNDVQHIKNELHLHTSQYSVRDLRELRELDVRAYEMQLRRMERQHQHDLAMERALVERPAGSRPGASTSRCWSCSAFSRWRPMRCTNTSRGCPACWAPSTIGLAAVFTTSNSAGPQPGRHPAGMSAAGGSGGG